MRRSSRATTCCHCIARTFVLNLWVACLGWFAGWVHTAGGCTRTWAPGIGGALRDAQAAVDVGATTFGIARWQDRGLGDSTVARAGFHSSISRTIYHALRGGLCYQDQRARKGQGAAVAGIPIRPKIGKSGILIPCECQARSGGQMLPLMLENADFRPPTHVSSGCQWLVASSVGQLSAQIPNSRSGPDFSIRPESGLGIGEMVS